MRFFITKSNNPVNLLSGKIFTFGIVIFEVDVYQISIGTGFSPFKKDINKKALAKIYSFFSIS